MDDLHFRIEYRPVWIGIIAFPLRSHVFIFLRWVRKFSCTAISVACALGKMDIRFFRLRTLGRLWNCTPYGELRGARDDSLLLLYLITFNKFYTNKLINSVFAFCWPSRHLVMKGDEYPALGRTSCLKHWMLNCGSGKTTRWNMCIYIFKLLDTNVTSVPY